MGFGLFIYLFIYITCKPIVLEQQMPTFDWKKVPLQAEVISRLGFTIWSPCAARFVNEQELE